MCVLLRSLKACNSQHLPNQIVWESSEACIRQLNLMLNRSRRIKGAFYKTFKIVGASACAFEPFKLHFEA